MANSQQKDFTTMYCTSQMPFHGEVRKKNKRTMAAIAIDDGMLTDSDFLLLLTRQLVSG